MKRISYRHYICIGITLACIVSTVLLFPNAIGRLIESIIDFGLSIAFYFCELFSLDHSITPTVNELSKFAFFPILPETFDGFQLAWVDYWNSFITLPNLIAYLNFIVFAVLTISQIIIVVLPLILILLVVLQQALTEQNNDYNVDSKPLRAYKMLSKKLFIPIYNFFAKLLHFIKEHKPYYIIWLCVWLFNFNVFTIILEFLAFYIYFIVSFDLLNIYKQVYKLFLDLSVPLMFIPLWVWGVIALFLINRFRKNVGYARLNHMENKNRGFINARPIVTMACGTMGKKKTTMITDMALSQEIMLRDKAFKKLLENDLKFPHFPWINLENAIKQAMSRHSIYNLATCKRFVNSKQLKFFRKPLPYRCFGYKYNTFPMVYNDNLKLTNIWETIETYTQLYFIYVIQSSLLISNYSIRTDTILQDIGNFPLWNSNFFARESRLIDSYSRHAHILDFDALRLGRKLVEDNPNKDAFEFGVVVITEVGKERGNTVENKEVKKNADDANQKNDLFNVALKMIRHPATVDNFPFVKVITDEQRPSSWGADARDLCEIIHIRKSGEPCLAMPFFALEELLYYGIFSKFEQLYREYRFLRGDNTLTMYLLKKLATKAHHYYTRTYNTFGYCALSVQIESGTLDGQYDENKYYLMHKKIYSKRFATYCYSEFFTNKALRSKIGLNDLKEYATEKATFDELQQQKSYFIGDLTNMENRSEFKD